MTNSTIHIIGAGLAGLSAAAHLAAAGRKVALYEAAAQAGGRCRSYHDRELGCRIDNGNHLMLTCNTAALFYLELIGAERTMAVAPRALFPFADLQGGKRWKLAMNEGKIPWWIFNPAARVPESRAPDYLKDISRLLRAGPLQTVAGVLNAESVLFRRLWSPLCVSIMNTQAAEASARLFAHVLREAFAEGGRGLHVLLPREGLSESLVDPALKFIGTRGGKVHFGRRLRALEKANDEIRRLVFADGAVELARWDWVVLAVPPWNIAEFVPRIPAPDAARGIVNAHFRVPYKSISETGVTGVIGGTVEWVFEKEGLLSTTTSAAEKIIDRDAEALAMLLWKDAAKLYGLPETPPPPHRVVKEKRATFAATPGQIIRRPKIEARSGNLVVCGDWTATGLPSTIEGAVRSGREAATAILPPAERRFGRGVESAPIHLWKNEHFYTPRRAK